jgi:signal transduction histidine kinase
MVWSAYLAIPIVLYYFARHRRDLPFRMLFLLFGLFIFACGTTHLMGFVTSHAPMYRLDAAIKLATGLVSWVTVFGLVVTSPRFFSMRMPEELEAEIQDRKRAEESLIQANEVLEDRSRELEALNRELQSFNYLVAHDLRAPLRGIVFNSRVLREEASEGLTPEQAEHLHRLEAAALKMGALVDALLESSRLTKMPLRKDRVDLTRLAREVVQEIGVVDADSVRITPGMSVEGDVHLIRLVLHNLIENAVKYAHPDRPLQVEVATRRVGPMIEVSVTDNGIGFEMEYVHKLFQPFERLHPNADVPGTGIGLANVRRIVERHGGAVDAEGAVGTGATFRFTLPAARP